VVVFRKDGLNYIKRVIAVGGDTVYVTTIPSTGREELVMDWEVEKLRRINRFVRYSAVKLVARRVPQDCCYVVGDHLANSVDSRELGPIGNDAIIGRMVETPPPTAQVGHLAVVYAPGSPLGRS
jgi:signal peptidase I